MNESKLSREWEFVVRILRESERSELLDLLRAALKELDPEGRLFSATAPERLCELYLRLNREQALPLLGFRAPKNDDETASGTAVVSFLLCRIETRPLRRDGDSVYVDMAYTLPEYRRRGCLTRMLSEMQSWARSVGIRTAELGTPVGAENARRFWIGRGFEETFLSLQGPTS